MVLLCVMRPDPPDVRPSVHGAVPFRPVCPSGAGRVSPARRGGPVEVGLERAFGRGLFETRFESKGLEFHQRLREGFLRIVEANPHRCVLIDAVGSLDEVEARVWQAVQDRLL